VLALIALLVPLLVLIDRGALGPRRVAPSAAFVVRIAPFTVEGGDARAGAIVADQLRTELADRLTTATDLAVLRKTVTTPEEALATARENGAEVVIWGAALPGATATAPGLRPRLTWVPDEPYAPRTWQGYDAHLALPQHFELAAAPLNGAAVLPPLLDALALFSRGEVDRAADKLTTLQRDYGDVLRPELPAALRAMVFWGEGLLKDSESEARRALEASPSAEYWNNVGALLLDQQQNDAAREALLKALAANGDLVAAHMNLGRLFMNQERPAEALPDLRTAAQVDTRPVTLASLAEAYRRSGQLEQAREVIREALARDPDNGPALCEQAILGLTNVATTTGRLEWELEGLSQRSRDQLAALRDQSSRGLQRIEQLHADYIRRAAAYGAAGRPAMQRLMETQARRLADEALNRRYQLTLVLIEQGRVAQQQPRSSLRRFWDAVRGRRTPLQEAIILADATLRQAPGGALQYDLQYQRGRAAYFASDGKLAQQAWDAATALTAAEAPTSTLRARPEAQYGLARLLLDNGKRTEARAAFERALAVAPAFFPARQALAMMAREDGRWTDAEPHLRWLAEHHPSPAATIDLATALRAQDRLPEAEALLLPLANRDDGPALALLGRMYREAGRLDAATVALERAIDAAPSYAPAYEERALIALARPHPDYAAAEAALRRAIRADPNRAAAHIELGKLLANELGRPGDAAEEFRTAVNLNQNDPAAYRELGETLLQSGAPDAAVESFKRALKLQPNAHETHHALATAYLAQGRYDAAAIEEQKALDLAGGAYTLALVGLGDIARQRGRYDEAVERYNAALQRDGAVVGAYLGLGGTASAQGNWDIARDHYRRGLEANPDNVPLLLAMGQSQIGGNDIPGALQTFEHAKHLAPGNAAAYAGTGQALWKGGRSEEALVELTEAVRRNPTDAETWLAIGEIDATRGRTKEALDAYERATRARKDWYEPHFRRGVLLLEQQQTAPAIEELQTTVKLDDQFAQGHYWLGRAYRAATRYPDALRQLRRAIALQDNYYEARFFLGRALDEQGNGADAVAAYQAIIAEASTGDPWRTEAQRELDRIR
jgi:tetratricopeptide (TPR) repeat protein